MPSALTKALEKKKLDEETKAKEKEETKKEEKKAEKGEERAEEKKEGIVEEESGGFFARLAKKITTSALSEEDFDLFFDEFEMVLLENNVALEVVDKIKIGLKESLVGKLFKKSEVQDKIKESLKKAISSVLIEGIDLISEIKKKKGVYVIVFFGVNGSGKTTSIAKVAYYLKKEGISAVLGAADTFRAASIEQLKTHGERIGVDVISSNYGADPAAVTFDAIKHAEKKGKKVVLIDTAGRMHTAKNLMKEMEKIIRVANPDLKIFVGEAITGNDATEQARAFNESVGIDGIVLAKADVDEKSGAVLSVGYVTSKPILFLGVGQGYGDLRRFKKEDVWKGLGLE
ncbi:signal recognition particle-docking protein FtsY [Candidatus Pacearchaeota archaeon]|nr:signal recognition particle-docking protein FtsY [Candidatus Pacearchaeota archaeon]